MHASRVLLLVLSVLSLARPASAQEPLARTTGFHGFLFGDVVYLSRDEAVADGFFIGQLVAHGNARMSERVSFFGEISATARPDGYAFEVERAIIRYDFADQFKLSAGRYHTPVSYWNTAYHHGLWLQTSVARPEIIKIGGRFLPVHFVGAMAEGTITSGRFSLAYDAGIGNGRGGLVSRAGDSGDLNRARALLGALRVRPLDNGLQLGGAFYDDRITLTMGEFDERIMSAHVVWDRGAPELIAEYARVEHDPRAGGSTFDSEGWYAHAGWRLPGTFYRFMPYARYERLDADGLDPAFDPALTDYRAVLGGLRYDFDDFATLKGEYRREKFGGDDWVNGLYFQVAFAVAVGGGM